MNAAILFETRQPFELREIAIDKPRAREVLVRVAASGLCHSDWHFVTGDLPHPMPVLLGHEVAGIVEAVGSDVADLAVGDHVVTSALVFCGRCRQCTTGHTNICTDRPDRRADEPTRLLLDGKPLYQGVRVGGFAEQVLVDRSGLVKIARDMPLDRAALLGCGVITGLGAVFNAAKVKGGSDVVVVGCGGVGLSVIQGARIAGANRIIGVDLNPAKRAIAEHFGATDFVIAGDDAVAQVRELTDGGADYSFEVIGIPAAMTQALQMLRSGGTLTLVGVPKAGATISIPGLQTVIGEWHIQGTYFGSSSSTEEIPRFAQMYLRGKLDLDAMISERIGLDRINDGYADMISGVTQARKVITFADVLAEAQRS